MLDYLTFILFLMLDVVFGQYEPQSNIDRVAHRPVLPQCPREWEWACRNGECIAHYDVCDGIIQCTDGSDEWNCDQARAGQQLPHEGNPPKGNEVVATTVKSVTTTLAAETGNGNLDMVFRWPGAVTIQYSHLAVAILAFLVISVAIIAVIRRRARKKSGFRNRRGNILQQDSDEDDILISSMYS